MELKYFLIGVALLVVGSFLIFYSVKKTDKKSSNTGLHLSWVIELGALFVFVSILFLAHSFGLINK